jgi:hypothetical protein
MKHPDDKRTQELPGLPAVKRRGRPPKNEFGAMTSAERQKAYRLRVRQQLAELDVGKLSRVALIGQLAQSLAELEDGQVEDARQVASYWSSKIVAEIVTRYGLKPSK